MSTYRAIRYRRLPRFPSFARPSSIPVKRLLLSLLGLWILKWLFLSPSTSPSSWKKISLLPKESTMIFTQEDVKRVWEWEIGSGHWMSWQPAKLFQSWYNLPRNPSLPTAQGPHEVAKHGSIEACGWPREYISLSQTIEHHLNTTHSLPKSSTPRNPYSKEGPLTASLNLASKYLEHPPRPLPGAILDLDIVSQYCSSSTGQYLRDCLEFLSIGAGLDSAHSRLPLKKPEGSPPEVIFPAPGKPPVRRPMASPNGVGSTGGGDWRYTYLEDRNALQAPMTPWSRSSSVLKLEEPKPPVGRIRPYVIGLGEAMKTLFEEAETGQHINFEYGQCDEAYPRIFHVYAGEGDREIERVYMTILSFLYTQNLGLHLSAPSSAIEGKGAKILEEKKRSEIPCRPELWIWINRHHLHEVTLDHYLSVQPYLSPLVHHPLISSHVKFKLFNLRDELDLTPEWAQWRTLKIWELKKEAKKRVQRNGGLNGGGPDQGRGPLLAEELFKVCDVETKDVARWIIPHRYGGISVTSGTLLLRDFEEIWNYRGAFLSSTSSPTSSFAPANAILKLNKASAIGQFILRTALRNAFALDAESVQRYLADAELEGIMGVWPDLPGDAGWSGHASQLKRPATPVLQKPQSFFEPASGEVSASALGVDKFFRGVWWYYPQYSDVPFDKTRNWPDISSGPERLFKTNILPEGWDIPWSAVFKRTYEAYFRGEKKNMYGEWFGVKGCGNSVEGVCAGAGSLH